jgi:CHAD domain-containing protein
VAPLASALAVVGVGVAVALAKGQLERRADRTKGAPRGRPPNRRPALLSGEPYAEGLRRVILGQLDLAIELLETYPGGTGEHTVHETRKALKRLRALLVLLRAELGGKRYARESSALRDCGRRLAGARDAEVMLGTLDSLVQRDPSRFTRSAAVRTLRAQLLAERNTAAAHAIHDARVRGEVIVELRAVRARAARWELRERGFRLLAPGLEDIYTRGRRRMRVARRRHSVEALHAWRKRVKDLRYAAETLDRGGKSYKPVRRVARRADRLGEMLGEEHDLALLEAQVRERSRQFAGERKTRKRLLALIASRRRKLRKRALREGERLYRRPPRRFVRRLKRAR